MVLCWVMWGVYGSMGGGGWWRDCVSGMEGWSFSGGLCSDLVWGFCFGWDG